MESPNVEEITALTKRGAKKTKKAVKGKTKKSPKKKGGAAEGAQGEEEDDDEEIMVESGDDSDAARMESAVDEFKHRHRNVRRNWTLPASFPSHAVIQAYEQPKVDPSKDKFVFGRPDADLLRNYCGERFGWDPRKSDELLVPILKSYEQRDNQLRMDQFLSFTQRFSKIKSKRLAAVVKRDGNAANEELFLKEDEK